MEMEANLKRFNQNNTTQPMNSTVPTVVPKKSTKQRPIFASLVSESKDLSQLSTDLPLPIQRG